MKVYLVQRQRTAGAYITLNTYGTKSLAVDRMFQLAAQEGVAYDGGDKFTTSHNTHCCNRYRIIESSIEGGI